MSSINPMSVTDNKILVIEILSRLSCTRSIIRSSAVNPQWMSICRSQPFIQTYVRRNRPAVLGFLAEFERGYSLHFRVVDALALQGEATRMLLRSRIDDYSLSRKCILASESGQLLISVSIPPFVSSETDEISVDGYYTLFPSSFSLAYSFVATPIPRVPRLHGQQSLNFYGQFGLLQTAGQTGFSFFVKDAAGPFSRSYDGIKFRSKTNFHVHVCVFRDGAWTRFVSDPFPYRPPCIFHIDPYSILSGSSLYMMYVVGMLICFDIPSSTFTDVHLPISARSCLDYTVSLNESRIMYLVNFSHGSLNTWLLQLVHGRLQWSCCSRLDLVHTFSTTVGPNIWQSAFGVDYGDVVPNDFQSVQIRSSSKNSLVVLLTFAFDHGMFVVDTVNCTVRGVRWLTEDGQMRQAFPLTERWPPTFRD
uniref:F-box protein AT5G49610-like beta-propeller domain-containing protein n=1 Tax=Hordeum vulgare subsp. vulgare TaxID=112509 RepID=A0A8I6XS10_HORVV